MASSVDQPPGSEIGQQWSPSGSAAPAALAGQEAREAPGVLPPAEFAAEQLGFMDVLDLPVRKQIEIVEQE